MHLLVDAACVTAVLRAAPPRGAVVASALAFVLAYDALAFAGQVPLGWLVDRLTPRPARRRDLPLGVHLDPRRLAAGFGVLLSVAAAGMRGGYAVVALAGMGNALFHLGAGALVLSDCDERVAPAGVFVAPGALGLGAGLLLGRRFLAVPIWPLLVVLLASLVVVARVTPAAHGRKPEAGARQLPSSTAVAVGLLLCLSVAVRSLVGSVSCDGCDKTLFLAIALPCAGFAGKLAGGFLADRFGWIELSLVALLGSAPLLAFHAGDLWLALPGLVAFQMTMPVTLVAMFLLLPGRPALAFGLPCLALFAGALPAYLPGGWRPHGMAVPSLVLGSALILTIALRRLLARPSRKVSSLAASHCFHPLQRRPMNKLTLSSFVIAIFLAQTPARADLAPPETEPCAGKAAGTACNYNGAGVCREETCTKLDYANWNRDASAGPPSTSYACMTCVTGSQSSTSTATNTTTATGSQTGAGTGTDTSTSGDGGWCAVGQTNVAARFAPWIMAAAFSLLFLVKRRRGRG